MVSVPSCACQHAHLWRPLWLMFTLDGSSRSGGGSALSLCLHMPFIRASHSSNPGSPKLSCGGGGCVVSSLRQAMLSALGSNTSGLAAAAFSATPMSLTLAVPSVVAWSTFTSNDAPPSSCTSTGMHLMAFEPAFQAVWTGPRPTPPASSGGSSHKPGGFKPSRWGSAVCRIEVAPLPGAVPCAWVSGNGRRWKRI